MNPAELVVNPSVQVCDLGVIATAFSPLDD